ncbi:hypothetical protein SAMN05518872_12412 [Psychrobacillus sp. OK032]|nr:hypothetical protein SAMN05518872_12412 [Psychrobacillus sp. OK032]
MISISFSEAYTQIGKNNYKFKTMFIKKMKIFFSTLEVVKTVDTSMFIEGG